MDLSKLNVLSKKSFSAIIPSLGIEVFGKPYTLDDEVTIASLLQLTDMRFFYGAIANLLMDKYSLSPELINKLTHVDIQWLIVQLKKNSDGSKLTIQFDCPKQDCGKTLTTDILLDDIKIVNQDKFKKLLPVTDTISIEVGVPPFSKFYDIIQQFAVIKQDDIAEYTRKDIELFKISILAIYEGDQIIDPASLDPQLFDQKVRSELRKQYYEYQQYRENEFPNIVYPKHVICANCKNEVTLSIDDFFYSTL